MRLIAPVTPPRPTRGFDVYWQFAAERQRMYMRRLTGYPTYCLTDDPILGEYRFTNAYRASDRVSQYLINSVQYDSGWNWPDTFVRTLVFKVFNRIDTWKYLLDVVGEPNCSTLINGKLEWALSRIAGRRPLYSPAYIMPAPRSYTGPKYVRHLALIRDMLADKVHVKIQLASSMAQAFSILRSYDSIGSFLAYQYIIDLNYSRYLGFSENEFTVPGPGALRGLRKCFDNRTDPSTEYLIAWTAERQEQEFTNRELSWDGLWGRDLKYIDVQNIFCEVDKYTRVAMPDLDTSVSGTRIKQRYRPNPSPALIPSFPPKWQINERVADSLPHDKLNGQYSLSLSDAKR